MIKIKVCGMKDAGNIRDISELQPDYMGFIFYPGSKRFIGDNLEYVRPVPEKIKKVGVFVNENLEDTLKIAYTHALQVAQLHGRESEHFCSRVRSAGYEVIKSFGINDEFDFKRLEHYRAVCNYFLFDTKSPKHGGTGKKFNWDKIYEYNYETPFFLSGGIEPDDAIKILRLNHPHLYAVDINSRFETAPGVKDVNKVSSFIKQIRND